MDFFKKLSETVMDTASTLSAKSADLVETGKLKLQRNQLENEIRDKKTEIGNLIYQAHKQSIPPDEVSLSESLNAIRALEGQIAAIEEKMRREETPPAAPADEAPAPETAEPVLCAQCGQELTPGAKFCSGCGQPQ